MMREIKFRAWRPSKEFMSPCLSILDWIGLGSNYGKFENSHEVLWMQYTGLKDKNGVEIYEGDICEVMYYTPFGDKTDSYYGKWVVTEWIGMFVLVEEKERISFTDFADVTGTEYVPNIGTVCEFSDEVNVRVIGNIHQHPHLLEK